MSASCRPLPQEPIVDAVKIRGVDAKYEAPLRGGLSTAETPLLLGVIPRVLEYATYDANILARDLLRIERYLRARGYYEAKVLAARVIRTGTHSVRIEIEVTQGEPVLVTRIDPGIATLPPDAMRAANLARRMADGDVLDEARFEDDRKGIEHALRDAGFAFAKVEAKVKVDIPSHSAHLAYLIESGPRARYGPITILGLNEIPEGPVRDNLLLQEGEPYSESELADAERALIALGVFANVDIYVDRSNPSEPVVPIQVRVRETSLRSLRLGGGVHFDVLRLFARFDTAWEHKNFLGGMRNFTLEAQPGVTLYPTRIDNVVWPTRLLPENRLGLELRQPSFLEGRTTAALSAQYNVYPLLFRLPDGTAPEAEPIIGYHEIKTSARVQRAFFGHHLELVPSYNWQGNVPIDYQGTRADDLRMKTVRVSFPELVGTLSFVDDPLQPRLGFAFTNSLQVAGHIFGGTVDDVRIAPELKFFVPVQKAVLAGRLGMGFLVPSGYGSQGLSATSANYQTEGVIEDQQKLLFRAFYSGGPNSNRGYPYHTIGPHGPIAFLVPATEPNGPEPYCSAMAETAGSPRCLRPLGGMTLWEASLEARVPFSATSPLWAVFFVDASDLTRGVAELRFDVPHLSPGIGLRYMTPVGPVRLDVGYRLPGAQDIGNKHDASEVGVPGSDILDFFPGAIHLAVGEAY